MAYRLALYGAGKRCKRLCKILRQFDVEIIAIIDSNPVQWGKIIEGYEVKNPAELKKYQDISVCITIVDLNAVQVIRKLLEKEYLYDLKRVTSYNEFVLTLYKEDLRIKQYILKQEVKRNKCSSVLFDCYCGLKLGGVQAWTVDICKALIESGRENTFIISNNTACDVSPVIKEHIIYSDIVPEKSDYFLGDSILELIDIIMEKLPCKVVTRDTYDVMLAAYLVKCYYPDMIDIISVVHSSNEVKYKDYMDFNECTDIYVGVSQDIKNEMIRRGVDERKIFSMTCPFACEETLIRSYTEDEKMPIHIAYAGRLDGMNHSPKRMDLLLQLAKVLEERKINFVMEIAGDGPARCDMEKFVNSNRLESKVFFLGVLNRSELAAFWKRQDVCINLADFEGRSISVIEAMGNGAIPVVTATSGIREDICDGINGYIVSIGDYDSAAVWIEYLAEHREELSKMGNLAHEAVYPKSLMEPHLKFWKNILMLV